MNTGDTQIWRRIFILALALFAVYQFGLQLLSLLSPFLMLLLLAWLISIAMEPPVSWFERKGYRRGLGAGVVLLASVLFSAMFSGTFGGLMFTQLSAAVAAAPDVLVNVINWLNATFDLGLDATQILASANLDTTSLTPIASELAGGLLGLIGSVFTGLFDLLTILVFAFYLSAEAPRVKRTIASWLKPDKQRIFITVWEIAVHKTGGFVVSRVLLASISAGAHTLVFWIIGVPYWLPMGLFAGITAQFVPTVGTYIGIAIPAMFSLTSEPIDAVWIIAFATLYQQIENYVLGPRISRATMDMHPAIALASVFVGTAIFGAIGALIGIPIMAGILAVVDTYGHRHELIEELDNGITAAAD
jgi:predicted PurR-regulated permease PerM